MKLAALSVDDGKAQVRSLLRTRQSRTVRRILASLRAALADAVDSGKIAANPLANVRVPTRRTAESIEAEERALTDEQVAAIIDKAPSGTG